MIKILVFALFAACFAIVTTKPLSETEFKCPDFEAYNDFDCCLVRFIGSVKRAMEKYRNINITDGITFVRTAPFTAGRTSKSLRQIELDIMNELPSDSIKRTTKLLTMLFDSVNSILDSHSLSFNLSKQSVARTLEEGRAKLKKLIWPVITIVGLKLAALIPVFLGSLGFLTLKALLIGKIALVIAGISAFEKFFGGDKNATGSFFNKYPTFGVSDSGVAANWNVDPAVYQSQSPSAGYRSLGDAEAEVDAHNLAYSAHTPDSSAIE